MTTLWNDRPFKYISAMSFPRGPPTQLLKNEINTPTRKYLCIHIQIQIHAHIHIQIYIQTYIHPYMNTSIHTYIHPSIHTYIHTYTYMYIHIYIYTSCNPKAPETSPRDSRGILSECAWGRLVEGANGDIAKGRPGIDLSAHDMAGSAILVSKSV